MRLHIITTGGTIDKIYFDAKSDYQVGEPVIGELLQRMGVGFERGVRHAQGQPGHGGRRSCLDP